MTDPSTSDADLSPAAGSSSDVARQLHDLTSTDRRRLSFSPEAVLGPFPRLPAPDRRALRTAVEVWDAAGTRGYGTRWFGPALRLLWRFRRWWMRRWEKGWPRARRVFDTVDVLAFAARRAPEILGRALHRLKEGVFGRLTGERTVTGPLVSAGVSPHVLAVCYARPLRQPARFRAFWEDEESGLTVGCVLGLDLVPGGEEGLHVIESNLDAAQRIERARLYRRDPFVDNLVSHAAERD